MSRIEDGGEALLILAEYTVAAAGDGGGGGSRGARGVKRRYCCFAGVVF